MSDSGSLLPLTLLSKQLFQSCSSAIVIYILLIVSCLVIDRYPLPICKAPDFSPWTSTISGLVFGTAVGSMMSQASKLIVLYTRKQGYAAHASKIALFAMMLMSSSCHGLTFFKHALLKHYVCEDAFGVRTHLYQWCEWFVTVPFMFYLNIAFDAEKTALNSEDYIILGLSFTCLLSNFSTFWGFGQEYQVLSVIYSVISMGAALVLNYRRAYITSKETAIYRNTHPLFHFRHELSLRRLNASMFLFFIFPAFPTVYFLRMSHLLDNDTSFVLTSLLNYFTKVLYTIFILDEHTELLDPASYKLLQEQAANDARRSFLRYVFHEVRVPLNSISMGLHLLHDDAIVEPEKNASMLETIDMMREATQFMGETLNDVLSIQKIEEGKLELTYEPFLIAGIIKSVTLSLKGQLDSKKIELEVVVRDNVPREVIGDRFRIEHVLANLLSNAIKFSSANSKIIITVSYGDRVANQVTFSVKDQGIGISEKDISNLFHTYMQVNPSATQSGRGTGVGLAICKEIIRLHGGSIDVKSKVRVGDDIESGGSDFFFSVPFEIVNNENSENSENNENCENVSDNHDSISNNHVKNNTTTSCCSDNSEVQTTKETIENNENCENNETNINQNDNSNNSNNSDLSSSDVRSDPSLPSSASTSPSKSSMTHNTKNNNNNNSTNNNNNNNNINDSVGVKGDLSPLKGTSPSSPSSSLLSLSLSSPTSVDSLQSSKISSNKSQNNNINNNNNNNNNSNNSNNNTSNINNSSNSSNVRDGNAKYSFRVLIVDDVSSNRKILKSILEKKGLRCDMAENGIECLEMVSLKSLDYYDIIFMDNLMPQMNGTVAAKTLRQRGFRNIIAGLTGNAMDEDVNEFRAFGADLVFPKPLRIAQLDNFLDDCQKHGTQSSAYK